MPHDDNLKQHPTAPSSSTRRPGSFISTKPRLFTISSPAPNHTLAKLSGARLLCRSIQASSRPFFVPPVINTGNLIHLVQGATRLMITPMSHPSFRILSSNRGFSLLCSPHWRFDDPHGTATLDSALHMLHSRLTRKKKVEKLIAILTRWLCPSPVASGGQ